MTLAIKAKAFKLNDNSRQFLQTFIQEQIPEDAKYVLASSEGYLFLNEEPARTDADGHFRIPHIMMVMYYDIEYEVE